MRVRRVAAFKRLAPLALLALAACGRDDAAGPGAVTADEARALKDAAQMLEGETAPVNASEAPTSEAP